MPVKTKKRINADEALELFEKADIKELGYIADKKRQMAQDDSSPVTFVIDRNINYTNICSCKCRFCAFYRDKDHKESYVLEYKAIKEKIEELVGQNGTQILLQGGLNRDLPLEYYTDLISNTRKDFPSLTIHAFSPPEIAFIAKNNKLSIKELLEIFVSCGLSSIPGGGAELLSENIRSQISPDKISSDEWLGVMESAHGLGLYTTATMVAGVGEKSEYIIEHLLKIRDLQDKTGKFRAFIPWTFQLNNTALENKGYHELTGIEYLKIIAISRIVLDNIFNIQVSWVTQGLKTAQLALRFGANDFGGTMLEENVVKSAGVEHRTTKEEIIRYINNAGFKAAQRDTAYNIIKYF